MQAHFMVIFSWQSFFNILWPLESADIVALGEPQYQMDYVVHTIDRRNTAVMDILYLFTESSAIKTLKCLKSTLIKTALV